MLCLIKLWIGDPQGVMYCFFGFLVQTLRKKKKKKIIIVVPGMYSLIHTTTKKKIYFKNRPYFDLNRGFGATVC